MKLKKTQKLISLLGVMGLVGALMLSQAVTLIAETVEPVEVTGTHQAIESKASKYAFDYEVEGTGIKITDLPENYKGELVIPSSIDGKPVTSIEEFAFYNCSSLTSIKIPASIKNIGYFAFYNTAWYNKQAKGLVYLDNWLIDYKGEMPKNTSLEIKAGTIGIASSTFKKCSSLASIKIPDSVTSIGEWAFWNCSSLTSIELPSKLTELGDSAFWGCLSLKSIEIPNGVTEIGNWGFSDCISLTSIKLPDRLTKIGDSAFAGCRSLTSIKLPDRVTEIGDSAFIGCVALKTIEMYNSVTKIKDYAFVDCPNMEMYGYIGYDNKYIKQYAQNHDIPYNEKKSDKKPLKPTNTKAVAESTAEIKVTWNKVADADGYEVYRFVNGRSVFYKAFDKDTTTFNNLGKVPNTTYYYKIRAYKVVDGQKKYSGYTDLFTCTTPKTDTKPLKPTNTKAVAQSTELIKVTWDKVSNADGYEVYRFVNGRSVFYKAFDEDTTTFNNAGKKPNTTYYYKIRAYKLINGKKLYSGYTNLFTCTTPKK